MLARLVLMHNARIEAERSNENAVPVKTADIADKVVIHSISTIGDYHQIHDKGEYGMKKSVLLAVLALSLASVAMADETNNPVGSIELVAPTRNGQAESGGCCACPADPIVTGDAYIGATNRYMFRGLQLNAPGSFNVQGGVDLTYRAFTLSYWTNSQNRFSGYRKAKVTENDIILDYAIPYTLQINKDLIVKFNVGTQYFSLDAWEDTNEFYFKAATDPGKLPVDLALQVYWDNLEAKRAGLYYTLSASHKFEIVHKLFDANVGALVSFNQRNNNAISASPGDGSDPRDGGYNGWHDYELTATLNYTPTANITISPSYQFSDAISGKAHDIAGVSQKSTFAIKAMFSF